MWLRAYLRRACPWLHGAAPSGLDRLVAPALAGARRFRSAADLVEGVALVQLRKHDAEAVLPQRVGRDQGAREGLEQDHRIGVVARRGMDLPCPVGKLDFGGQQLTGLDPSGLKGTWVCLPHSEQVTSVISLGPLL